MSVENKQVRGDASVSRNASMGGNARVQGSVHIGHNLRVDGWIEGKDIKAANKGLFISESELKRAYPNPQDGWFAGVGETSPFTVYIANGGVWQRTNGTFAVDVDMSRYNGRIDELESQLESNNALIAELIEIIREGGGGADFVMITLETNNTPGITMGSVSGGGLKQKGSVTVTATAENGYHFVEWQDADGNTIAGAGATYTFDATESVTLKAVFAVTRLEISVVSNNDYLGRVSITEPDADGKYTPGTTLTLTATEKDTNPLAYFHKWSDGDTANPRYITAREDKVFEALFYERQLISIGTSEGGTVEVRVNGEVRTGSVYVKRGDAVELTAIGTTNEPSAWQDNEGNEMSGTTFDPTEHKRKYQFTYTGEQSLTFTPVFDGAPITVKYTVELTMEPQSGAGSVEILIGSDDSAGPRGEFEDGTTIMLTATKNEGWQLARWEKGSSQMEAEWDDEKGKYILSITVSQATAGNYKAVFEHVGKPDFYYGVFDTPTNNPVLDGISDDAELTKGWLSDNVKAQITLPIRKTFVVLWRSSVVPTACNITDDLVTGEYDLDGQRSFYATTKTLNNVAYAAREFYEGNTSSSKNWSVEITFAANNSSQE